MVYGDGWADPLGELALIGRAAETEIIDGLLDDAFSGRSGVLVLTGEAGAGKSALLAYARARADGMGGRHHLARRYRSALAVVGHHIRGQPAATGPHPRYPLTAARTRAAAIVEPLLLVLGKAGLQQRGEAAGRCGGPDGQVSLHRGNRRSERPERDSAPGRQDLRLGRAFCAQRGHRLQRDLLRPDDRASVRKELAARGSQRHGAGGAVEQVDAELPLQTADLLADRR